MKKNFYILKIFREDQSKEVIELKNVNLNDVLKEHAVNATQVGKADIILKMVGYYVLDYGVDKPFIVYLATEDLNLVEDFNIKQHIISALREKNIDKILKEK